MANTGKIKIILASFDKFSLVKAVNEILVTVRKTGATINGPVPLPTKIEKFCVLRSPHVDKDSREQFEIRTSKRHNTYSPNRRCSYEAKPIFWG